MSQTRTRTHLYAATASSARPALYAMLPSSRRAEAEYLHHDIKHTKVQVIMGAIIMIMPLALAVMIATGTTGVTVTR
jgi:hypothetical protein